MTNHTGPKQNVIPLLFQSQGDDGEPRTTYGGLLATDDGTLMLSNLSTGDSIAVDLQDAPAMIALLQDAITKMQSLQAPLVGEDDAIDDDVNGEFHGPDEDVPPGEIVYPDGREVTVGDDGIQVIEDAPKKPKPIRRAS